MRLDIHNIHKIVHSKYHKGRFVCTKAIETETNYRFQFSDTKAPSARYVWVEVSRIGRWDRVEKHWEYRLNYPNCHIHSVTADWFGLKYNAIHCMEECLNYSL